MSHEETVAARSKRAWTHLEAIVRRQFAQLLLLMIHQQVCAASTITRDSDHLGLTPIGKRSGVQATTTGGVKEISEEPQEVAPAALFPGASATMQRRPG